MENGCRNSSSEFTILTNNWCVLRGLHGYYDFGDDSAQVFGKASEEQMGKSYSEFICKALSGAALESHESVITIMTSRAQDDSFLAKALHRQCRKQAAAALEVAAPVEDPSNVARNGDLEGNPIESQPHENPDPDWMTDAHAKLTAAHDRAMAATDSAYI